jgi:hypothetical protein
MIRAELFNHASTPSLAIRSIVANVKRSSDCVDVSFLVVGQIELLRLPTPHESTRADELWQHTCFELFARSQGNVAYSEFNFSPSMQWAAYTFTGYRKDMTRMEVHNPPRIDMSQNAGQLQFDVKMDARDLPGPIAQLALSAVIEERSGSKSYWAVAHRADKPDFHHEHGFVLTLA